MSNQTHHESEAWLVAKKEMQALREQIKERDDEILRLRTTLTAAAHALDTMRQHFGLDLIDGEHPMDTATRIKREAATRTR